MEKSEMKAYKAFGYYMLGVCYKMLGRDEEEVVKAMKSVAPYARDNQAYDKYGLRKAKQYLKSKKGFHPFELQWLPAYNLLESQEYERCDGYLDKCRDILNEKDNYPSRQLRTDHEAMYYYVRGASAKLRGDWESAKKFLPKCIGMKGQVSKDESFVVAFALIAYADACLALLPGDNPKELIKEASSSIDRAKDMKDYDFDNVVSHRTRRSEHTLAVAERLYK
uniref:KIF-binding protein n=2 Tax=Paramoeba aestuarina TaxID=180227 RepID=A0A7S4P229_9EUKA|mmetsp:Transcript_35018/g.54591  ORF Transcript_35018/g.54591 Transcript_35018/m.54591 type:complete len:223 (+) Transcript_35018:18-686(+)